jgi:glycosyltransferase involved in cell wall biosynthesis
MNDSDKNFPPESPRTKLAIVSTFFAPGGVDSFWKYILEISPKSIEFHVLHQENLSYSPLKLQAGAYYPFIKWFDILRSSLMGLKYFKSEKPDIIAFNGTIAELHLTLAVFLARLTHRKWQPKIIRIFHSSALYRSPMKNAINKLLLWSVGKLYGHNKFVSNAVQNYWRLPGVVAVRRFPRKVAKSKEPKGELRVGYFGRISHEKGPDRFCEIMNLSNPKSNIHPVIIGDGDMMNQMKRALPGGEFHGWVDDPMAIIATLDIVLITSRSEGLGLAYGECLEMGVPVIGFNVGGCSELLGEASCLALVKDGNVHELVEALEGWSLNYTSNYQAYFNRYDRNSKHNAPEYLATLGI